VVALTDRLSVSLLLGAALAVGTGSAFFQVAYQSFTPLLVRESGSLHAVVADQTGWPDLVASSPASSASAGFGETNDCDVAGIAPAWSIESPSSKTLSPQPASLAVSSSAMSAPRS
jgi:hypothetical protein